MTARYEPTGIAWNTRDFWYWGRMPDGYDVMIQHRSLLDTRDGTIWPDGWQRVLVVGPQPRPKSKTFKGEMAWANAQRYAGDVVAQLQRHEGR